MQRRLRWWPAPGHAPPDGHGSRLVGNSGAADGQLVRPHSVALTVVAADARWTGRKFVVCAESRWLQRSAGVRSSPRGGRVLRVGRRDREGVRCVICREDIPAGSSTPLAVQALVDPEHETVSVIVASHARCAPSGVHRGPGLVQRFKDRRGSAPVEVSRKSIDMLQPLYQETLTAVTGSDHSGAYKDRRSAVNETMCRPPPSEGGSSTQSLTSVGCTNSRSAARFA